MSKDAVRVVLPGFYSLDLWSDVMNLHAVLVSHHHVVCSPRVRSQDHTILTDKYRKYHLVDAKSLLPTLHQCSKVDQWKNRFAVRFYLCWPYIYIYIYTDLTLLINL